MDLGKWGVFSFTDVLTPAQVTELAQRTEQLGYTALWYPEVLGYESFALGSFLLTQTTRLVIASGIANMYARDATAAKQGQHTLAKLSGGRFLLGLGVSHGAIPRGTAPDGAGGLRSADDGPGRRPDGGRLALQCHPRAHGPGAGHPRPGPLAVCRAKGAPDHGRDQGP
jgi:hypothetical protein